MAVNENAVAGVTTKVSPRPVAESIARLTGLIAAKGMKTFAVIDQGGEVGVDVVLERRDFEGAGGVEVRPPIGEAGHERAVLEDDHIRRAEERVVEQIGHPDSPIGALS